jgi:hypothetical protein
MFFLHFYNFSRLNYLLALVLVLSLVACSSGGNVNGSSGSGSDVVNTDNSGSDVGNTLALSWVAPSEREDNTGLSLSDIAGFRIYYGAETGNYQNQLDVNDHTAEQAQIAGIPAGTYYVVMTTIDVDGRESAFSSEVVVTL